MLICLWSTVLLMINRNENIFATDLRVLSSYMQDQENLVFDDVFVMQFFSGLGLSPVIVAYTA